MREGTRSNVHFRVSGTRHPLQAKPAWEKDPWSNREKKDSNFRYPTTPNHVWSEADIQDRMEHLYHHKPQNFLDYCAYGIMRTAYHSFNFITGYKPQNTPVKAVEWRLIILESVAGCPPFVAAGLRHFRSLRSLERDHGWIPTLLEEAENERMHLLVCLKMFKASPVTRALVVAAQFIMVPFLAIIGIVRPKLLHRFVGYLEETACESYSNFIIQAETPGTPLHEAWADLPAPNIAKSYWLLAPEATWIDTLKCIFADEANHRDVNHTFAVMPSDDPNPFVEQHQKDAAKAWRLVNEGRHAEVGCAYAKHGAKKPSASA